MCSSGSGTRSQAHLGCPQPHYLSTQPPMLNTAHEYAKKKAQNVNINTSMKMLVIALKTQWSRLCSLKGKCGQILC